MIKAKIELKPKIKFDRLNFSNKILNKDFLKFNEKKNMK